MKRIKLLVLLSVLTFTISCGQQKRYVSYKVKKGETINDIANRFNLKAKDLLRLNPDVKKELGENTTIIIPNPDKKDNRLADNTKIKTTSDTPSSDNAIPSVNVKDEIKEVDIVLEELKQEYVIHKVKPKETVYGLTRFYNITSENLFALNPEVQSEGLKIDQIIKIKLIKTKADIKENDIFQDDIKEESDIKLVLLLPFRADEYEKATAKDIFKENKLANIVTDFYMGAQIAIDSIKKMGVMLDVQIFDTGKKGSKINSIISNNNLDTADAIIGPFYSEEAKLMSRKVESPIIFPMYSKSQNNFSSSKLIKASPDKDSYQYALVSYLTENYHGENIIVVGDDQSESNKKVVRLVSNLKKHDSIHKVHVLKPKKGYIKKERFTDIMKPKSHNWVIVISDDNVVVADALNSMISLPEDTTAQIFTVEKNKAFDRISNNKLARINFTYVTDEYVDETTYASTIFNKKYKSKNNTLPSNYATKGFDITYDILARLASNDNDLKETFKNGTSYRIVSKFDYNKHLFGATSNNGLFIVKYNYDLSLTRLK